MTDPSRAPNFGCTLSAISLIDVPEIAIATIPISVSPIPVIKNPPMASGHPLPEITPRYGGKIRFPAPKNIANNANPTTITSLFLFKPYLPALKALNYYQFTLHSLCPFRITSCTFSSALLTMFSIAVSVKNPT